MQPVFHLIKILRKNKMAPNLIGRVPNTPWYYVYYLDNKVILVEHAHWNSQTTQKMQILAGANKKMLI